MSKGILAHLRLVCLSLAFIALLSGCDEITTEDDQRASTPDFFSAKQSLGDGNIRSFVEMKGNGVPKSFGIVMSENALEDLPTDPLDHVGNSRVLPLPEQAGTMPFNHVFFNWNPGGHEPPGTYDVPHFDIHFYLTSIADRMGILPSDPNYATESANFPALQYLPAGFFTPPPFLAVPMMGVHWLDPNAPEFNGETFTSTFIYGTYDGHMTFIEPMITLELIESARTSPGKAFIYDIPQPQAFEKPGYYPTQYSVRYNPGKKEFTIAMEKLVLR